MILNGSKRHYSSSFNLNFAQVKQLKGRKLYMKDDLDARQSTIDKFYITTPIYYVNGEPHLGHAYTSVLADVIARYHRKVGKDVYFLSGTDEHGQKVEQSAAKANKSPLLFADEVSAIFRTMMDQLQCTNNDFIRTTEIRHKQAVEHIWNVLVSKNQIYLGAYEGWYSIRDEAFYAENELIDGKAPTGAEVSWVKEESYFFKLSQWTEPLLKYYEDHPQFIAPRGRRNEVVSFVGQEGGLKDLSISRTTFSWGIPVTGDPKHVVYVWLDALVNYISALGYPASGGDHQHELYDRFWPAAVHIVGKDILRFHAVFWPAFLMAADLPLPQKIFAHGWWTKDGEKMSKSLGNVISPFDLLQKYPVDYIRYFLTSEIHFGNDGDFSEESFMYKINSELANDLGNLVQRALAMINKHCQNKLPIPGQDEVPSLKEEDILLLQTARHAIHDLTAQLNELNIKSMVDIVINLAKLGNRYIDHQAPWTLAKTDVPRMKTVLYVLVELLRIVAIYLEPIIPTSCEKIFTQLGIPVSYQTFQSIEQSLSGEIITLVPTPIFPKLEILIKEPTDEKSVLANKEDSSSKNKKKNNNKASDSQRVSLSPLRLAEIEAKYVHCQCINFTASEISKVGDTIRQLKAEKADKSMLETYLQELQFLKERYKQLNNGVAYSPSAVGIKVN